MREAMRAPARLLSGADLVCAWAATAQGDLECARRERIIRISGPEYEVADLPGVARAPWRFGIWMR